jgi:hypothetical protein
MIADIHCLFKWQDIPEYFFVWTDTGIETPEGLKRVLYNHGRFYSINEFILAGFPLKSDIIMVWGRLEADLIKKNYPDKKVIISGNPIFDDIIKKEFKIKEKYNILFVPDHWDSETPFLNENQEIWDYLLKILPEHNLMIKTTQNIQIDNRDKLEFKTDTEDINTYDLIKKFLFNNIDICICMADSKFALFAHLTGIPVICIENNIYDRLFNGNKVYMYKPKTLYWIEKEQISDRVNKLGYWILADEKRLNYELKRPAITDEQLKKELYEN